MDNPYDFRINDLVYLNFSIQDPFVNLLLQSFLLKKSINPCKLH